MAPFPQAAFGEKIRRCGVSSSRGQPDRKQFGSRQTNFFLLALDEYNPSDIPNFVRSVRKSTVLINNLHQQEDHP
jgi:hypothetical protein